MRFSSKCSLMFDENSDTPYAIYAESSFTAEHEQPLDYLYDLIGGNCNGLDGLDSYSLKPSHLEIANKNTDVFKDSYLWQEVDDQGEYLSGRRKRSQALCLRLKERYGESELASKEHWRRDQHTDLSVCWSSRGFEIMAFTDVAKKFILALQEGIKNGDFACFEWLPKHIERFFRKFSHFI